MRLNRLYTWTDVQNEIYMEMSEGNCPENLIEARSFWDGLHILVKENKEEVILWLQKIFESRFEQKEDKILIILDSLKGKKQYLEVYINIGDEEDITEALDENPPFRPLISKPTVIHPQYFKNEPPDISSLYPPIFAFHSFKGGVARTVHAIAFALLAVSLKHKILLVDADLEAPGITWMLENPKRELELKQRDKEFDISFSDMLAIVHSNSDDEKNEWLDLIENRTRNIFLNNMFIMPAFRSPKQTGSLEIKPEHLIKYSDDPYIMTRLLGELGKRLEADAVIVDLRAGLSELSAGLLLDPRIHRIFVTTLSDQSLTGTYHELEYIGKIAGSSKKYMPLPTVIFSMVPHQYSIDRLKMDKFRNQIENALRYFTEKKNDSGETDSVKYNFPIYKTPFNQELLVLPGYWDEVISLIDKSGIKDEIYPLLKGIHKVLAEGTITFRAKPVNLREKQKKAVEWIKKIDKPKNLSLRNFYISDAMRILVSDYSNKIPAIVIGGIEKSGKTAFFYYFMRKKSWKRIVKDFIKKEVNYEALITPVFIPINDLKAEKAIENKRKQMSEILKFDKLPSWENIWKEFINADNLTETEWRDRWLDYFAWSLGFHTNLAGAGDDLLAELLKKKTDIIFVIDLPEREYIDEKIRTAFKALIRQMPQWLEKHPQSPIGVIIFCSFDLLKYLFEEDTTDKYLSYQLKMTDEDVLRFSAFLLKKLGFLKSNISIYNLSEKELNMIEADLRNTQDDMLVGYQLKAIFDDYKKHHENITPNVILSFFKNIFEILSDNENKITIYEACRLAMEKAL